MHWTLPEAVVGNPRVYVSDQTREWATPDNRYSNYNAKLRREVRILGVQLSDEGEYACRAVIPGSKQESLPSKYYLRDILGEDDVYIAEPE